MGGWSSSPSTGGTASIAPLVVESANVVAQRNGTNAQISYVYGSYTDASNYSRVKITHSGSVGLIGTEGAGSGSGGNLDIAPSGSLRVVCGGRSIAYFNPFPGGSENDRLSVPAGGSFGWSSIAGAENGSDTALKRNAAGVVEINNGTGGTYRDLLARNVRTNPTTVASLTAAATAGAGARSFVTDATSPTWGATVAGGGAVSCPVYSDGTNWKVG